MASPVKWTPQDFSRDAGLTNNYFSTAQATERVDFPRFMEIVMKTRAENVISIAGDIHVSTLNVVKNAGYYPITEITTSAITEGRTYNSTSGLASAEQYENILFTASDSLSNNKGQYIDWQSATYTGLPDYTKAFTVIDVVFPDYQDINIDKNVDATVRVSCYALTGRHYATDPVTSGGTTRPAGYWGVAGQTNGGNFKCIYNTTWGKTIVKTWEKKIPLSTLRIPPTLNLEFKHAPITQVSGSVGFLANVMNLVQNYDSNILNWYMTLTLDDSPASPSTVTSKVIRIPAGSADGRRIDDFPLRRFQTGSTNTPALYNVFMLWFRARSLEEFVRKFGKVGEVLRETLQMKYIGTNTAPVGAWGTDATITSFSALNTKLNSLLYASPNNFGVARTGPNITIDSVFTNLGNIA